MADGKGYLECTEEHDGDFYRFCHCTCHSRILREIVDEADMKKYVK